MLDQRRRRWADVVQMLSTNVSCLLGNHIGPGSAVVEILTNLLCLSHHASQLASDPAKGGHGVINSIYGRVVNNDVRCLNTMSIFDESEERNYQIRRFRSRLHF